MMADVANAFPGFSIIPAGATGKEIYEIQYCFWLQVPRVRVLRVAEVFQGICLAFSKGGLPKWYFEAVALVREDAEGMEERVNAMRRAAETKAKHGFGD